VEDEAAEPIRDAAGDLRPALALEDDLGALGDVRHRQKADARLDLERCDRRRGEQPEQR
jgi:hypothetical protein